MEKQIQKQYKQANKELTAKWNAYMENANKRIAKLQDEYDKAKKAGEDVSELKKKLEDAKKNETLRNAQYKAMIDETTNRIANANKIALDYINDQTAGIYVTNYNSSKETADKYNVDFTQVDEHVVKNLMQEKHLNVQKDKKWNSKQLNSAVLQGILQGESMDKIAKRIMPICENNSKSAIRNARTMVTQAENKGRLDGYEELENEGLILTKVWIATEDDRTRASHLEINGEEVGIDEEFSNGLMYPADPNGDPEEVYNCRCTMVTNVVGYLDENGELVEIDEGGEPSLHEEQMTEEDIEKPSVDKHIKGVSRNSKAQSKWLEDELGYSEEDAKRTISILHDYTKESELYSKIHNNDSKYANEIKALDDMINNPNMPTFDGAVYRGVHILDSDDIGAEDKIRLICENGTWNEAGITSFSSKKASAENFAKGGAYGDSTQGINVLIINKKNKKAVPIQHLSNQRPEGEVLYSSKDSKKGFKITKYNFKDKIQEGFDEVTFEPKKYKQRWCIIEVEEL